MNIDELKNIIRELIKSELEEASTLGTGASFSAGSSEAYSTPRAFKKKRKRQDMAKKMSISEYRGKSKVSRPGIHTKTKHSNHKSSKHYNKLNRGQGR